MAPEAVALGEPHPEPELGEGRESRRSSAALDWGTSRSSRDSVLAETARGGPGVIDDAPPGRQQEVVQLLAALQPPAGSPGGLPELREWAQALPRLVGLSQKATLEVCRRMADCIGAERPPKGELTRESLQQAFVRIGGAREVINAMVLHSDSADSVLACLRCMSAATQGAPFAAETLELQSLGGVTPILRCVEKHSAHLGVAAAGVELIAHLCAPLPEVGGREVAPARTRAHRELQRHLASHGAADLIANLIALGLKAVHDEMVKAQLSVAAHRGKDKAAATVASEAGSAGVQEYQSKMAKMQRLRSFVSTRALWGKYLEQERLAGRLQEVGLQALVLMGAGNADTSRVVSGSLWCYEARHNPERRRTGQKGAKKSSLPPGAPARSGSAQGPQQQAEVAGVARSVSEGGPRASAAPRGAPFGGAISELQSQSPALTPTLGTPGPGAPSARPQPRKTLFDVMATPEHESRRGSKVSAQSARSNASNPQAAQRGARRASQAALLRGLPPVEIDPNSPLATADAFARGAYLPTEVLLGRACRDRPEVAARACRLVESLAAHHAGLLRKVSHGITLWASQTAVVSPLPGAAGARAPAAAATAPLPAAGAKAGATAPPPGTASSARRSSAGGSAGGGALAAAAADSAAPEAPLVTLLLPVVRALMLGIRLHRLEPEVLAAALRALAEVRQVALLSAPDGEAEPSWQAVIAQSQEEEGELGEAARTLEQAVRHTDVANSRMAAFQLGPDQLRGSGGWMSPRMRRAAAQAVTEAKILSDDVMAAKWARGDPERVAVLDAEARRLEEEAELQKKNARWGHLDGERSRARAARRALKPGSEEEAVLRGPAPEGSPLPTGTWSAAAAPAGRGSSGAAEGDDAGQPPSSAPAEDADAGAEGLQDLQEAPQSCHEPDGETPPASAAAAPPAPAPTPQGAAASSAGGDPRPTRAARRQQEAAAPQPPTPPPQWLRALGYGSHDAADFDRVWRQPLTDVMARSFSTPSLAGSRLGSLSTPGAASAPQPAGGAAQQGAPDALDRLLSIEMVRSQPGQLRARITVQPPTKVSQNMADARLRELTDQARAASLVGSELAKQMRRDRCLLPRYGLQVSIKKARSQPRVRSSKSGVSRMSTLESTAGAGTPGAAAREAPRPGPPPGAPREPAEL